jgi:cytochrome P450
MNWDAGVPTDIGAGDSLQFDPMTGHWVADRYDVARAVLNDTERFELSSAPPAGSLLPPGTEACMRLRRLLDGHAVNLTPAGHRLLQQALRAVFTKHSVDGMRPELTARIRGLVERRAAAGRLDVVADIAEPLYSDVVCVLSGWPLADEAWMLDTSKELGEIVASAEPPSPDQCLRLEARLHRFDAVLAGERSDPGLGRVVEALLDVGLDPAQSVAAGLLLRTAGVYPLTAAIAKGVALLVERDLWDEAAAADHRLVDELLRYTSPVAALLRVVSRSCEPGSSALTAGDRIIVSLARSNRDGAQFEDPDSLISDRASNNHLAFGSGLYRCQGAHLAREVVAILLRELGRCVAEPRVEHMEGQGELDERPVRSLVISFRPVSR